MEAIVGPKGPLEVMDRTKESGEMSSISASMANADLPSFITKGIKTGTDSVDEYLLELFIKIKEDKEAFLDQLSTPLNRDPVEILGHLQAIEYDENNDSFPYQQSVLHVEMYLENEKERRVRNMTD